MSVDIRTLLHRGSRLCKPISCLNRAWTSLNLNLIQLVAKKRLLSPSHRCRISYIVTSQAKQGLHFHHEHQTTNQPCNPVANLHLSSFPRSASHAIQLLLAGAAPLESVTVLLLLLLYLHLLSLSRSRQHTKFHRKLFL